MAEIEKKALVLADDDLKVCFGADPDGGHQPPVSGV
jgi:hypothetical protein